jgi:hypothetical protein
MPTCLQNVAVSSWLMYFGQPVPAAGAVGRSGDQAAGALSIDGDGASISVSDGDLLVESCRVTGFSDGFAGAILDRI